MTKVTALMKFLSKAAKQLGVGNHVFIVGGAVRNFIMGLPPKDVDVVVDTVALGSKKDSGWFASQLAKLIPVHTNLTTNQYGVAILTVAGPWQLNGFDMQGEVIEIANARKESYGDPSGKGYKPHLVEPATIEQDLERREFTFNTLLWRLADLEHGPDKAEVLDLLGVGLKHLEDRELRTPVDPDKTFSDDPTRLLRAVKFVAKYGFKIPPDMKASIQRNAPKLKQMPWDAVRKILVDDIIQGPAPRKSVALLHDLGLGEVLKEMLHGEPGFATALSRSLPEQDIHLVLDLVDLGWTIRTPVSFLRASDLQRLRDILLQNATDQAFEHKFVKALIKPPIDQVRLFDALQLKGGDRQRVAQEARRLLLDEPSLMDSSTLLEQKVEEAFRTPKLAERVVDRFQKSEAE
jgi:tRNA nucleotidyltransferase/poly(A) polymerase